MLSKSIEDEREPSPLEYARCHKLTCNWATFENKDDGIRYEAPMDLWVILQDPVGARGLSLPYDSDLQEKLIIPLVTAQYLASLNFSASNSRITNFDEPGPFFSANLKLELPLLNSDPEVGALQFGRHCLQALDCAHVGRLLRSIDQHRGLERPAETPELPVQCIESLTFEKLELPRDVLTFIQSSTRADLDELERLECLERDSQYQKNNNSEPQTPPLFPQTPLYSAEPAVSPIVNTVRGLNSCDSIKESEQILEDDFLAQTKFKQESVFHEEIEHSRHYSHQGFSDISSSSPIKSRLVDFKVDELLSQARSLTLPASSSDHNWWKGVAQQAVESNDVLEENELEIDAIFKDIINPKAIAVGKEIENEQLQEADSTKRVPVPISLASLPIAPWQQNPTKFNDEKTLESLMQPIARLKLHYWSGSSKIELALPWSPFPATLGSLDLKESIEGGPLTKNFICRVIKDETVDHAALSGISSGLMFRKTDYDDELEIDLTIPYYFDSDPFLKKRKSELDSDNKLNDEIDISMKAESKISQNEIKNEVEIFPDVFPKYVAEPTSKSIMPMPRNHFSASDEVDRFLEILGNTVKKPRMTVPGCESPFQSYDAVISGGRPNTTGGLVDERASRPSSILIPVSDNILLTSRNIVVSSAILAQRTVINAVTRLSPILDIIEREFTDHSQGATATATVSGLSSNMILRHREADISISPCTGIIITSLQKIKQKALPGQKARPSIKDAIACIAPLYERLILLVSQGLGDSESYSSLESRDSEALVELNNFIAELDGNVTISFVAGGHENMARYIINLVYYFTTSCHECSSLLAEETMWELFLRKAGMNSFAAQMVLRELKSIRRAGSCSAEVDPSSSSDPPSSQFKDSAVYGLSAFVLMDSNERLQRFERILGGRKTLACASNMIDAEWNNCEGLQN